LLRVSVNPLERGSILGSLLGIVVCGGVGGLAAWVIVSLAGFHGTFGAIVAAIVGMLVATALWAAGVWLLNRLRRSP
jgi:hypothetical protein